MPRSEGKTDEGQIDRPHQGESKHTRSAYHGAGHGGYADRGGGEGGGGGSKGKGKDGAERATSMGRRRRRHAIAARGGGAAAAAAAARRPGASLLSRRCRPVIVTTSPTSPGRPHRQQRRPVRPQKHARSLPLFPLSSARRVRGKRYRRRHLLCCCAWPWRLMLLHACFSSSPSSTIRLPLLFLFLS